MSNTGLVNSRLSGFKNLTIAQRRNRIAAECSLEAELLNGLDPASGLSTEQADAMVENVIGVMGIPLGVATNFLIDGSDYLVPMATEEPSVVAAASNAARMARPTGGFFTSDTGPVMIAQIALVDVPHPAGACAAILENTQEIVEQANACDPVLCGLGGGALDLTTRVVPTRSGEHIVCHLDVDVRDAMGANAVNSMAEAIAPVLSTLSGGRPLLRILSNKAEHRLVRARAVFACDLIGGAEVAQDIEHASAIAEADPYRAVTHNKGIMNGVSAVVLATGNDTRAVESGCHSHAAFMGQSGYGPLSRFEKTADGDVIGTLEVPMLVGLVGGATKAHPVAGTAVKILGVKSAIELGRVIAAVGLAQNFAACRALVSEGIQQGHMRLHARMLATSAGATGQEVQRVADSIVAQSSINLEAAKTALMSLRGQPDEATQ